MARPPKTFHDFVGQKRVVRFLKRLINGAQTLAVPFPSLLLAGPSGYGKTSLGRGLATEFGTKLHSFHTSADTRPVEICEALLALEFADFLFIDEAHSLGRDAQQALYGALDDGRVPAAAERRLDRRQFKNVAQFTLILATNEPGSIKPALKNRLTQVDLEPYREEELRAIADRVAAQQGIVLSPQAATHLAKSCLGSPRQLARRVDSLHLFWPYLTTIQTDHVRQLLADEGVDEQGLREPQRQYLMTLVTTPDGVSSLERLAIKLGCDSAHVRRDVEPYLIDMGLVAFSSRNSRVLTSKGRSIVKVMGTFSDCDLGDQNNADAASGQACA